MKEHEHRDGRLTRFHRSERLSHDRAGSTGGIQDCHQSTIRMYIEAGQEVDVGVSFTMPAGPNASFEARITDLVDAH
jgi:hypothetical protein